MLLHHKVKIWIWEFNAIQELSNILYFYLSIIDIVKNNVSVSNLNL